MKRRLLLTLAMALLLGMTASSMAAQSMDNTTWEITGLDTPYGDVTLHLGSIWRFSNGILATNNGSAGPYDEVLLVRYTRWQAYAYSPVTGLVLMIVANRVGNTMVGSAIVPGLVRFPFVGIRSVPTP